MSGYVPVMDLTPSHSGPTEDGLDDGQPHARAAAPDSEPEAEAEAEAVRERRAERAKPATEAASASEALSPAAKAHAGTAVSLTMERATAPRAGHEIGGKKFRVGSGDEYVPFRSRTKRRRRMIVTCTVVVLLLTAGAYGVVSLVSPPSQHTAASGCAANGNAAAAVHVVNARPPTAGQIKLNVYNSTNRHGLAAATANVLKQRGFAVAKVTNDPLKANLTIAAQIRGSSAQAPAMRVVAAEVTGSQLQPDTRTDGTVDLVLGTGFTALATPDQVSAALKAETAAAAKAAGAGTGAGHCG